MKQLYNTILKLVNATIHNDTPALEGSPEWPDIYTLLIRAKLEGSAFAAVCRLAPEQQPSRELMTQWKSRVFQRGLSQIASVRGLGRILEESRKRDIPLILFKGLPLADLYPNPNMRFTSDVDLLVSAEHCARARTMLEELGYEYYPNCSKNHVHTYKLPSAGPGLSVELHDRLWEDFFGEQTDYLDALGLDAPETLLSMEIQGISFTTLGYEEHLIYQIFHMAKHFSLEGLRLRYLTDIALYVGAYHDRIDFPHFWEVMRALKYNVFCDFIFRFCVKYLEMDAGLVDISPSIGGPDEDTVIEDILLAGKSGNAPTENYTAAELLSAYFVRSNRLSRSRTGHGIDWLFPSGSELKSKFSYAKKHSFLLPIAWIHRFFSAIWYMRLCKKNGLSALQVLGKAESRLALMDELGLVDKK